MVPNIRAQDHRRARRGWAGACAIVLAATVAGGPLLPSMASAQAHAKGPKPTKVVKEVNNPTFGEMLFSKKKMALYVDTTPPCTAGCLVVWPPLLMPKGKTVPGGVSGLGTVPFGSGMLQVTYKGMPLYTFSSDHKNTVTGNGLEGFVVAQVT